MEQALCIAKVLNDLHTRDHQKRMDQMRMHKLMYYVQKESLRKTDKPLFEEEFEGWKFGPVLPCIREAYVNAGKKANPFLEVEGEISPYALKIVETVYQNYIEEETWDINSQTHEEFGWLLSREGKESDEAGNEKISLDAIRLDILQEMILDHLKEG